MGWIKGLQVADCQHRYVPSTTLEYFTRSGYVKITFGFKVWGVVDLYGMTVKVTIVDRDERDEQNLITRRNLALRSIQQRFNQLLRHRGR